MVGGLAAGLLTAVRKFGVVWFGSSGKVRKLAPGITPLVQLESYGRGTIATVDLPEQHVPIGRNVNRARRCGDRPASVAPDRLLAALLATNSA
jgi:hypothetical protein